MKNNYLFLLYYNSTVSKRILLYPFQRQIYPLTHTHIHKKREYSTHYSMLDTTKPHFPSPQQIKHISCISPFSKYTSLLESTFSLQEINRETGDFSNKLEDIYTQVNIASQNSRVAAVLLLSFQRDNITYLLFIKRANRGMHPGQIGLPGGKKEPTDPTYLYTALRETHEEIGVNESDNQFKVFGNMQPFISNQYKFMVVPFVGVMMNHPDSFNIQSSEVDYILEVPLSELADNYTPFDEYRDRKNVVWRGPTYKISNQYIFNRDNVNRVSGGDTDVIWGLTARILTHYFYLLSR